MKNLGEDFGEEEQGEFYLFNKIKFVPALWCYESLCSKQECFSINILYVC